MVDEKEVVVVVVVSFFFNPSSLFSFVLHFVAFDSSPFCGDIVAVVVEVDVVALNVVAVCFLSLALSTSFFFGTVFFSAVVAASLNFLHLFRCPPFFQ